MPLLPRPYSMHHPPAKLAAARAALELVTDGMTVGLGTGSTATVFIQLLGAALDSGTLRDIVGLPTSNQSDQLAKSLGIPLVDFNTHPSCDVTIDGADEVCPALNLIKGLGGALLREKVVAQNSKRLVVIADTGKCVERLGTKSPLPVEVTRFALAAHERFLASLGCTPTPRRGRDGLLYTTDNGNHILDCQFPHGIDDPTTLARKLESRAGLVEHGLFLGMTRDVIIGRDDGTVVGG